MFKVENKYVIDVVLVFLFLTLNKFHTFFLIIVLFNLNEYMVAGFANITAFTFSGYLHFQSQQWKHKNNVLNLFKVKKTT